MAFEDNVVYVLRNDSDVASIIARRVYPSDKAPQGAAYPFVVYSTVDTARSATMGASSGLVQPRIQLDLLSESKAQIVQLAEYIRLALDGKKGTMNDLAIQGAFLADDFDNSEVEEGLYRRTMDFQFYFNETVTTF